MRCSTVIYDPDRRKFRMWYTVLMDPKTHGDNLGRLCYAESDDGIVWRKPMMRICDFAGRLPTNIVAKGPSDSKWGECLEPCVLRTPHDPKRLYKMLYSNRQGPSGNERDPRYYGLLVSSSTDGLHWDEPKLVLRGKCDNHPSVVYLAAERKYFATMRAQAKHPKLGGYWRVTGIAESLDYNRWSPKKALILTDDRDGYPSTQFHDVQLSTYGDVIIGMASVMYLKHDGRKDNKTSTGNTQLIVTRNGWKWGRVADRAVFVDNGPKEYDRELVMSISALVVKDDTIYVYYAGSQFGMGRSNKAKAEAFLAEHGPGARRRLGGLCLATLPADRFVALEPARAGQEGVLRTHAFQTNGRELLVNAALGKPTDLCVELLDTSGNVLPGFDRTRCRLIVHDKLRYRVVWTGGTAHQVIGAAPAKRALAIRFLLRSGSLYAFQVTP